MAIIQDKSRGTYYISYKLRLPDGTYVTRNIRDKDWTKKSIVKNLEEGLIEQDKKNYLVKQHRNQDQGLEAICENFITNFGISHKRQTTYNANIVLNKYIIEYFKRYKTKNLDSVFSPENLDSYKMWLSKTACSSYNYNEAMRTLRQLTGYAYDLGLISSETYNRSTRILINTKENSVKDAKLKCWTPEEFNTFLKTFDKEDQKRKMFFEVEYYGALRIGEILALTWNDFYPEQKRININKALDKNSEVTTCKNASSCAPVDLPSFVVDDLLEYKKQFKCVEGNNYIFFIEPTSRTSAKRMMDKHTAMANLPDITLHGLRHSMASRMINKGLNVLIVSKHLRHASTQQTLDTYSHLFAKITEGVMDNI